MNLEKNILAIGAHPDDIELGCGGTVSYLSSIGYEVYCVFITRGEKGGNPVLREKESQKACSILGAKEVFFGDFKDTEVSNSRDLVMFLEKLAIEKKASMALIPNEKDTHQDHRNLSLSCLPAFRKTPTILSYESPSTTSGFCPQVFFDIGEHMETKRLALEEHITQKDRDYLEWEAMMNLASYRGNQASSKYAEAFEPVRIQADYLFK